MNIIEPILHQCWRNPPAPAICAPGGTPAVISYGRLERAVGVAGRRAMAAGLAPGDVVGLRIENHILHAVLILALAGIGVTTFSMVRPAIPLSLRPKALITDQALQSPTGGEAQQIQADLGWIDGDDQPPGVEIARDGSALARIQLSSGSTGEPKAIALSHDMLMRRTWPDLFLYGDAFMRCSRVFSDLPLSSGVTLRLMVILLSRGGTLFLPGATPMDTLQGFELYRVEGLIAAPGGLDRIVGFYERAPHFCPPFTFIGATGSMLHQTLSARARARLCSNLIFFYGSSETGTVAATPAHIVAEVPGAAGRILPGYTVSLVGPDGRKVARGEEGIIQVHGPTVIDRYFGQHAESDPAFRDGVSTGTGSGPRTGVQKGPH